ncbi:YkuS family protein [Calderihabitans maritimus]|uniref:YkuS family protein n=1 Tax=Calderihabitans maritimus TaxID=1246530 RepID=A0A1Z5HWF2_9FIRM|nr:YkuS family protein [Calderihabitans maritimus]GAW93661.1 hypothetical protein KKC1_27890 [Calderihabitans maritimus]
MARVVGVEEGLENVRQALEAAGFKTVTLGQGKGEEITAAVISGTDRDLMEMEDIKLAVPVIDARGKSAEEVLENVKRLLH